MSSAVNQSTFLNLSGTYDANATVFGAFAIGLLVILIMEKELIRAVHRTSTKTWFQVLDIAIVPLLFVFCVIILIRTINLIHL